MESALLAFIGTLCALVVTKTIERLLLRRLESADLARDALVDILSTLTSVEAALPQLVMVESVASRLDLRKRASSWGISPPSLSRERLLSAFDSEKVHRLIMLYFERMEAYSTQNQIHNEAYFWLLDNPDIPWSDMRAEERRDTLDAASKALLEYARDMLRFGYDLALELLLAGSGPNITRLEQPDIEAYLAASLYPDRAGIALRKGYYAAYCVRLPFQEAVSYRTVVWDDEAAALLRNRKGVLALDQVGDDQVLLIPPCVPVAVPRSSRLANGRVGWDGGTVELEGRVTVGAPTSYGSVPTVARIDLYLTDARAVLAAAHPSELSSLTPPNTGGHVPIGLRRTS